MKYSKYSEVYQDNFLDIFKDNKKEVSDIQFENGDAFIDVEKIISICGIEIERQLSILDSGSCLQKDGESSRIVVNKVESKARQRFTLAHELGHIMLGHKGESFRRMDSGEYKETFERMKDVAANKFAADLIMPEKLVISVLRESIKELKLSEEYNFNDYEINKLIDRSAEKMKVSSLAFEYRLKNMGVLKNV